MNWRIVLACALLAWIGGSPIVADDARGGEVGVIAGVLLPDRDIAGESGNSEVVFGFRGGSVFSPRWGFFVDALVTDVDTLALGTAKIYTGRTGFDFLLQPDRDRRWFLTGGAGWMVADYDDHTLDFHRPLVSLGFGQRIRAGGRRRIRWEVRGDATIDDARLGGKDVTTVYALVGLNWGPGTGGTAPATPKRRPAQTPTISKDADGDSISDRRDDCPRTPAGARVDARGCSVDIDGDGIPAGIDRCPNTLPGAQVGADGCPADRDGDGVGDGSDACPGTPAGATVDEWGCPRDGDADRVLDGLDRCPDTPRGAWVDALGCPADTDGDGVLDGLDRCPDTPAGVDVDPRGCPEDDDRDGVTDRRDRCPDTPAGATVDADGCPPVEAEPLFEENRRTLILEGVRFETNNARLTLDSTAVLDRIAQSLAEWPEVRVEIGGHTDAAGRDAYNLDLSGRRAEAVHGYLLGRGIDAARMTVRGYGETRPLADNGTATGRATNRRVELKRLN